MNINKTNYDKDKKSIVIIEGPQGCGKTNMANFLRESVPFSNLYRLSGISDKTSNGYNKTKQMYFDLLDYMKKLELLDMNLLFDRHFFTEENYCRLGYKEYKFTEVYNDLVEKLNALDFNIYIIFLYLENPKIYEERLKRDKTKSFTEFTLKSSVEQQNEYLKMSKELEKFNNLKIITIPTDDFIIAYDKLHELLPLLKTRIN